MLASFFFFFDNLTQATGLQGGVNFSKKVPPSHWPGSKSMDIFLISD